MNDDEIETHKPRCSLIGNKISARWCVHLEAFAHLRVTWGGSAFVKPIKNKNWNEIFKYLSMHSS